MLKHKDDIRRRLTLAEVPKPPADLVQKIKHDIPRHFTSMAAKEVERKPREASPLWNFWGMSWQLAAAILVLVGLSWAMFESYRSEMSQAARIADAGDTMSVEEFEAQVTEPSEAVRIEGPAVMANEGLDEAKKDKAETPAAPPAPSPQYARETESARRQERGLRAGEEMRDAMMDQASAKPSAPAPATVAEAALPGEEDQRLARAPVAETTSSDSAKSADASAASEPSRVGAVTPDAAEAQTVMTRSRVEPREVVVRGLTAERLVKVELRLDAEGRVVDARMADVFDEATIDAVTLAAKRWTFAIDADDAGRIRLTRTIEVQLRKGN